MAPPRIPDGQQVELIGTSLLTTLLLADGIEVSQPIRDRGIDLIAYLDIGYFRAVPIQIKASSQARFGFDRKYEKFPDLRIVHLWNVQDPQTSRVFCTTFTQAADIAQELGWTTTRSWEKGIYSTAVNPKTASGQRVLDALRPYEVSSGDWHGPLFGLAIAAPRSDERFDDGAESSFVLLDASSSYRFELDGETFDPGRTGRVLIDPVARILWVRQDTFDGEPFVPDLTADQQYMFRPHGYITLTTTSSGFLATRDTPGERLVIERDR